MMLGDTKTAQYLAREFMDSFYKIGLKLVQVASTDRQPKNRYALQIEFADKTYTESNSCDFLIDEETLKDAVTMFVYEDSIRGSEIEYEVTNDLIEAVFAIVKAILHSAIAIGHVDLLFDTYKHKALIESGDIGKYKSFVVTTDMTNMVKVQQ